MTAAAARAKRIPPRLHALIARDARRAVVFRRGPSAKVATIGWDLRDDSFALGQWLSGRIYERRCDLSPDGKHLLYFAMNGHWRSPSRGSWTALSRAPYLKALGFWPKGDCWEGGGLFLDDHSIWLNDRYWQARDDDPAKRLPQRFAVTHEPPHEQRFGAECLGVYFPRLMRDGWTLVEERTRGVDDYAAIFEKPVVSGWTLRKTAIAALWRDEGRGVYFDEHELRHADGASVDGRAWEWAEIDRRRVVYAERGALHALWLNARGVRDRRELADFSGWTFEAREAPY